MHGVRILTLRLSHSAGKMAYLSSIKFAEKIVTEIFYYTLFSIVIS